ncbi:MAG: hypothetical protein GXY32_05265 [Ruminococcaceae bacterium]|nr:hypothetical protein [Oscillospiraceae bacterium]
MPKKTVSALLVLCLLTATLALAACTSNPAGENFAHAIEDWKPESRRENYGEPSEIVPYDAPDFTETLGFAVVEYPDTEALSPFKFFAIDKWFCQIEYQTDNDRVLVVRIAREDAGGKLITDTYSEGHFSNVEHYELAGDVTLRYGENSVGCAMGSWVKNGFQYLVHSNKHQTLPSEAELETLALGLNCEDYGPPAPASSPADSTDGSATSSSAPQSSVSSGSAPAAAASGSTPAGSAGPTSASFVADDAPASPPAGSSLAPASDTGTGTPTSSSASTLPAT